MKSCFRTKEIHTILFIVLGTIITIISFASAINSRGGAMNPGGEYFIPVLFYAIWKMDMCWITKVQKQSRNKFQKGGMWR